jgi:F-type H+-transporting ATPase subunit epsilon
MPETFLLEVATPERLLVSEQVSEAQVPGANGYVGLLPGHASLLTELGSGELTYTMQGRRRAIRIDGGWLEVSEDRARVLAGSAETTGE